MKFNTEEVAALQPDYLGFIFWEPSPRYFNHGSMEGLSDSKKVGVFVNATIEHIILQIFEHDLDAVQLHGEESPEYCARLKNLNPTSRISKVELIKAFAIDEAFNFASLAPYESSCDYYLFDTRGELPGGTGKQFDWQLLKHYHSTIPFFLSGGIGPEDVAAIVEFKKNPESRYCYAIDVNSRFEKQPGLKDTAALKKFIEKIGHTPSNK
ncbi:MAG: phosphoribosylanthranilate isomerase [Flavobacteriaceae bacterium]